MERKKTCTDLEKHDKPDSTIPSLQDIQTSKSYISEDAIIKIAKSTRTNPSQVFGVSTFYNRFQLEPQPKYVIRMCHGTACHVAGSEDMTRTVTALVNDSRSRSRLCKVETVACLGCCSLAPCMMINEEVHGRLTAKKAAKIIQDLK